MNSRVVARGMAADKLADSELSLFGKAEGVTRVEARSGGARRSASSLEGAGDGGALQIDPEEGSMLEPLELLDESFVVAHAEFVEIPPLNLIESFEL